MVEEAIFVNAEDTAKLKKALAKKLYAKNFAQLKISEILNISQPMVSNYCNSKDNIPEHILNLAEEISDRVINGDSTVFHTCVSFDEKPFEGPFFVAKKNEVIRDENSKIVDNLTEAFLLLKGKNVGELLPEVKVNIAMAKDDAEDSEDIAAFLNGLVIVDDRVSANNGIRFGKSKHLSSLLLYLKNVIDVKAIMNIAFIKDIKKTGFAFGYLTKDFKLDDKKKNVDILLHKGDFGIEPCSYVIGKDAVDVVNKIIKINEELV